jgi:hypothetical protein
MKIKKIMSYRPPILAIAMTFILAAVFPLFMGVHRDTLAIYGSLMGISSSLFWAYYLIRMDQDFLNKCVEPEVKEAFLSDIRCSIFYWGGLTLMVGLASLNLALLFNFVSGNR